MNTKQNTNSKKYKNIIFDMGNVLLRYEPETFLDIEGITDPEERNILLENINHSPNWAKMDTGEWNEEDLEEEVVKVLPENLHEVARRLISKWDDPILLVQGMEELVKRCKDEGYKIYLLSNASRRQSEYWENVPGHQYFDGTVVSAFVEMVKPDPEIYKHLLEKFDLKAEECLFIDDLERNIKGAQDQGIDGFLFNGNTKELENFIFGE